MNRARVAKEDKKKIEQRQRKIQDCVMSHRPKENRLQEESRLCLKIKSRARSATPGKGLVHPSTTKKEKGQEEEQ